MATPRHLMTALTKGAEDVDGREWTRTGNDGRGREIMRA